MLAAVLLICSPLEAFKSKTYLNNAKRGTYTRRPRRVAKYKRLRHDEGSCTRALRIMLWGFSRPVCVVSITRELYFGEVPNELTSRYAHLLLGEQMGKDI